jgi:hypothetical protein
MNLTRLKATDNKDYPLLNEILATIAGVTCAGFFVWLAYDSYQELKKHT